MEPINFDFVRFREYRAEREERVADFLLGKPTAPPVLVVERAGSDYTKCRTPEESLRVQLEAVTRQMAIGSDFVPYLEPWFGVGVYANAFGAVYEWVDGESPQTRYVAHSAEQASRLTACAIDEAPAMTLVLDAIDYFVERTRGEIPIAVTDTQSPFDTATLLWDTADFFTSVYSEPAAVHALLGKVTELVERFTRLQMQRIGPALARPGHIMVSAGGGRGLSVSDDNIVMVSPEIYESVAVPYNGRLARAFGGLAVHSCGNYERQLPALLGTDNLVMIDGAFSTSLDPSPNTDLELFRQCVRGRGVVLQARLGPDWARAVARLYAPDLRLVACIPEGHGGCAEVRQEELARAVECAVGR